MRPGFLNITAPAELVLRPMAALVSVCVNRARKSVALSYRRWTLSTTAPTSSFPAEPAGRGCQQREQQGGGVHAGNLTEAHGEGFSGQTPACRYSPGGASTSRGLAPLVGPTMPSRSICSTMRAARL